MRLHSRCTRSLLILLQSGQELSESLFASPRGPAFGTLATEIHQLRNAFPARASGTSVFPVSKELVCLLTGLVNRLFLFVVVVVVEVVDGGLCSFYSLLLLLVCLFCPVGECKITTLTPFPMLRLKVRYAK